MRWSSNVAKWRWKEKNCLTNDVRSYRWKIRQYPQWVELGKIEQVYRRIAKFAEKVHGKGIWTRRTKADNEFLEHSRSLRKTRRKCTVWCSKLKTMYRSAKNEKICEIRVRSDTCWLWFGLWRYLITTITSHHRNNHLVTVSLADSTDDCTGIRTGNDAS